jgi:hypothetical protein
VSRAEAGDIAGRGVAAERDRSMQPLAKTDRCIALGQPFVDFSTCSRTPTELPSVALRCARDADCSHAWAVGHAAVGRHRRPRRARRWGRGDKG